MASPRESIRKGERIKVIFTVSGLGRLAAPAILRIENRTTRMVAITGGNVRRLRILPSHVGPKGVVVREIEVLGLRPGPFTISSWFGHTLFAHLEAFSREWGEHEIPKTLEWYGSDHSLDETESTRKKGHDFDATKVWRGHGHASMPSFDWGRHKHGWELSRVWRRGGHSFRATAEDEEAFHHGFEESSKKGWYGHQHLHSMAWDKGNHDYTLSRHWAGDDHGFELTAGQTPGKGDSFKHEYEDTRTWDGDGHHFKKSLKWEEPKAKHDYKDSKKERGERDDGWRAGGHNVDRSGEWEDRNHDFEASWKVIKKWYEDGHDHYRSDLWDESAHGYDGSVEKAKRWKEDNHSDFASLEWEKEGHDYAASIKKK